MVGGWLQLYQTEGALLLLELRQMQVSIWLSQKEKKALIKLILSLHEYMK